MIETEYRVLFPRFLPLPIHSHGDSARRMTLTCQTRSQKIVLVPLYHTYTHTQKQTVPFLLTHPELSRDRLTVTQCCPATSDLAESSRRADPWLTTEIQLPDQLGRREREEWEVAGRKKLSRKFASLSIKHCSMLSDCNLFHDACSKGQDSKKRCEGTAGQVQFNKLIGLMLLDTKATKSFKVI